MAWKKWIVVLMLALAPAALFAAFDPLLDVRVAPGPGAVVLEAPPGVHLKTAFLNVALKGEGRIAWGPAPAPTGKDELGEGLWRGSVVIPVRGEGLGRTVELVVTYQPCTEGAGGLCYAPVQKTIRMEGASLAASFQGAGSRWALLGIFAAGLLAALSPCVYPMIPVTMAVIGARGGGRGRGLLLSLMLVLGMATTYTALGVFAAQGGAALGALVQHPAFLVPVSLLLALFAASLFGAFEMQLPGFLQSRLQRGGARRGVWGAFLAGMVLGPLAAPCVGPVVGGILLRIAQQGSLVQGALQLFLFALGMGVLFVVAGVFAAALPRSGDWMLLIRRVMGVAMLGFAVWNLRSLLSGGASLILWSLALLVAGWGLGAFRPEPGRVPGVGRVLGVLVLSLGLALAIRGVELRLGHSVLPGATAPAVSAWKASWLEQDLEQALVRAQAEGKGVLVDVYAVWCTECVELDRKTWPDPGVAGWVAQHAVPVRIDTDRVRPDLQKRWGIVGYPTVLLLDQEGRVLKRREGFQDPSSMLQWLTR